jgi:hypothetical protein
MRMQLLAILSLPVILAGCGATTAEGPSYLRQAVAANQSEVVIMRPHETYVLQSRFVVDADVKIDGREIGELKTGGYLTADVAPGEHVISAAASGHVTEGTFTASAGGTSYIGVWDETRMAAAAPFTTTIALGLVAGPIGGAVGATGSVGAEAAAYGDNIWGVAILPETEATQKLSELRLSR